MANDVEVISADGEIISGDVSPENLSLAIQLSRAEIDQKITTARAYPRQVTPAANAIMALATLDEATAEECSFSLPRGGKPIVGPSVRFAEIVAQNWGNCLVGARVVHVDRAEKYVEAEGIYHDLQTNASTTARIRRRISGSNGKLYNEDMILMTGNAACAIARRNAILTGVPKAVWNKAYLAAEKVVKGDIKTLTERRANIFKAFAAFGVKPEMLFAYLGVAGESDITIDHMPGLTGMRAALKDGTETVESMFGNQQAAAVTSGGQRSTNARLNDLANRRNAKDDKPAENKKADAEEKPAAENKPSEQAAKPEGNQAGAKAEPGEDQADKPTGDEVEGARMRGYDAYHNGQDRETCPREYQARGVEALRDAWFDGFDLAADESSGGAEQ